MDNKWTICNTSAAAIGGGVVYWLGGLDRLLVSLLALMAIDYLTGLMKAFQQKKLSSLIGFRGIAKKVVALSVVALAFVIQELTAGAFALREMVITFFIANEGLSILENAALMGIPIPPKLRGALAQLRDKGEK